MVFLCPFYVLKFVVCLCICVEVLAMHFDVHMFFFVSQTTHYYFILPPTTPQCPASTEKVPYCAEEWTPATAGLSEWGATESDVLAMKHQLFLFNQDKPSYAR